MGARLPRPISKQTSQQLKIAPADLHRSRRRGAERSSKRHQKRNAEQPDKAIKVSIDIDDDQVLRIWRLANPGHASQLPLATATATACPGGTATTHSRTHVWRRQAGVHSSVAGRRQLPSGASCVRLVRSSAVIQSRGASRPPPNAHGRTTDESGRLHSLSFLWPRRPASAPLLSQYQLHSHQTRARTRRRSFAGTGNGASRLARLYQTCRLRTEREPRGEDGLRTRRGALSGASVATVRPATTSVNGKAK
jgi:hypothetical protein